MDAENPSREDECRAIDLKSENAACGTHPSEGYRVPGIVNWKRREAQEAKLTGSIRTIAA
jgi:hypothetical protein